MQPNRQAPSPFLIPGSVSGASGAQATLILLVLVFLVVLIARSSIGDAITSTASEFAQFRVWGAENKVDPVNATMSGILYDARVLAVNMPSQMIQGDTATASITMKNTGAASWYGGIDSPVILSTIGGAEGDAYRFSHIAGLPLARGIVVRNDSTYAFNFTITAPAPGQYLLEYRMNGAEAGDFGETARKSIKVVQVPTPSPTPAPLPTPVPAITPTPTFPPYETYLATGTFILYDPYDRRLIGGPWDWAYDGPFGRYNLRSSYFGESSWPHPDWDIGGPNGQYHVYKDGCTGSMDFSMNYGGYKGTITFKFIKQG